jgi:lysophospholipase L1-like esterase
MSGIQGGILKASGQPYRPYGIGGTTLLGGGALSFLTPIPQQYQGAIMENANVKTVIMTGGGNDILQSGLQADCQMKTDACGQQVIKILDRLSELWTEMAEDGVKDVVYILYATPMNESVDFALPDGDSAKKRCENVPAPMRCHILETLDLVMGDIPDGIHPSAVAADRIGQAVVDLLEKEGIRR